MAFIMDLGDGYLFPWKLAGCSELFKPEMLMIFVQTCAPVG